MPSASLGIDIGGTFTGLVLHAVGQRPGASLKLLTTPANPLLGVTEGVRRLLAEANVEACDISRVVHTTTLSADGDGPGGANAVSHLAEALATLGIAAPLLVMLADGALVPVAEALRAPALLLRSGAAAGLLAAAHLAGPDERRILAFDMGGASFKFGVIEDGEPELGLGLTEIPLGGGSAARLDAAGLLKLGPACHGCGGRAPTVTDANLLLGYLDPAQFTGRHPPFDHAAAGQAVGRFGARLDLDLEAAAWRIHDVVTEAMASAVRAHLASRGMDARDLTLFCTGGGGPAHGHHLARKLGMGRLVVPAEAGVASARGMLAASPRIDLAAEIGRPLHACTVAMLHAAFARLEAEAREAMACAGWTGGTPLVRRILQARCMGGTALPVTLPPAPWPEDDATLHAQIGAAFQAAHQRRFHRPAPPGGIELVQARIILRERPGCAGLPPRPRWSGRAKAHQRAIFSDGRCAMADIYSRCGLLPGFAAPGPALVEEAGSTLVICAGGRFTVLDSGNIVVEEARGG